MHKKNIFMYINTCISFLCILPILLYQTWVFESLDFRHVPLVFNPPRRPGCLEVIDTYHTITLNFVPTVSTWRIGQWQHFICLFN